MAKSNEVMAKVRITIGGIEASKKNLNALQTAAEQMSEKIKSLNAQKVKLVDANDVKGADAVVKEMNKLNASLKATREMIRLQESELNNYTNILDNLAGTPLINLQKGLRDLQAQMKQTLTLGDVERYAKLKAAYDQLMSSVDQLSGKMPNLTYVMKNLGQVADKTLADSIAYSEKLIASTDKTTKRGRDNIKAWTADLKAMRAEMSERSIKVLDNPQAYSVEQIQQSIANLKKLQPVLKLSGQAWENYAQKIKQGEEYLKSYDEKQKQIAEKEMRRKTNEVLANPAGFSQGEVEEAIRNAEKLQKAYKTGSPWWIHYKEGVDKAKESLDAYNKKQKEAEEANRKLQTLSVLNDPFNPKLTQQQLEDAIKHGKELQKLLPHMGDEWRKYAEQIKRAEEVLGEYAEEQKEFDRIKRMSETKSVLEGLSDPSNQTAFTTQQIQDAIKHGKELQANTEHMGAAWLDYAAKIKVAEERLDAYNKEQKELVKAQEEAKRLQETTSVLNALSDPNNQTAFTTQQIQDAIKHGKELQANTEHMGAAWLDYAAKIKVAEERLDAYNKEQKELVKAQEEAKRLQETTSVLNALSDPNNQTSFTTQQIEDAIKHGKELQKQTEHMGPAWRTYAAQIKVAEEALEAYSKELKKVAEDEAAAKRKTETDAMLTTVYDKDVKFSEQQLETFVRNAKEIKKELEIGGTEWQNYTFAIQQAEKRLKAFSEEQKESSVRTKALTAINESSTVRDATTGAFNISANEAKERVEAIQKYIDTLNMSTQAKEIEQATAALEIYNTALGKVKDTTVDVAAILKDPKNFSTEEIQKAIKQLEETGLKIEVKDTDAIQQNIANIEKLKTALADSAHSQTFVDQVIKDAKEGKASVEDLEKAIAATKEKLRHTKDATMAEKLKQDLDQLNPKLELTKTSLARVTATLGNIKGANLGSLKEAAERLKVELNDVNLKMDDFAEKAAQLKKVNAQIKELEAQTKNVASAWDNAVSRLKNWVLIYAGSSEIWNKMVQAYQGTLKLSDAMTDVRKTTGLTADEVERLTDEVQELDTRITNEKLMEAATEAGRIGLKTRQEVLEFTRASAITLTALDELDARSITSVMKLNELLGETARLGVQQAILSTASSINELSMASSAAQQPIIDFSRRFGGIAAQANISTAEVLGLGATIDALGQPIEMSSTALNKFTTALLSNGKQIAEDTGLSEEYVFEMTRQGKTIELMIEVLGKLNNMGGIGEISKYMGDMGGDGARMTAVVSALAANLGFLREQIDLSKMSFEEGISVINEYNLKNENAAALVARMGNEIKEVFVDSSMVSAVTAVLRVLQQLVHFMLSGTAAAKAFNAVLILIVTRIATMNKTIGGLNDTMKRHIVLAWNGRRAWVSWSSVLNLAKNGVVAFGKALKAVFATNPLGWLVVGVSLLWDWIFASSAAEEQTEKTRSAIDRANEAFEEESYKLNKLRDSLEEVRNNKAKLSEIASTLNRDYGKELGYVVSMTASYGELAGAIDLVTAAKRKQILQQEKDKNFQNVQDEYREQTNTQINALKKEIGIGSGKNGWFEDFSADAQKDLYVAIAQDLNASASTDGAAELGAEVEKVLRSQAKAAAQNFFRVAYKMTDEQLATFDTSQKEQEIYEGYKTRLENMDSITELGEIYSQKVTKLKELDEEVDRQLVTASANLANQQQKQIDLIAAENDLSNKAAKDYTAEDENTLSGIISLYESMLVNMDKNTNMDKWNEINDHIKFFKLRQREVMLAFVENPLRGIKMKVGEDGKLYKEVLENGKYQYEAVKELSDANLRQLVDAYRRTESTFQKLISDENHLMDSEVRAQAEHLSKVKTSINKELKKNGIDIDDKGNLKLRNTEYRDGSERTARQEDSEMRKAYQALLNNIKEFYEKKKQMVLDDFINERATVEQKNRRIEELTKQHNDTVVAMQTELLGEGNAFNEAAFIRDQTNFKKVAGWMLKDTHHFQDEVRKARAELQTDTTEQEVKYREEVVKILLGNDYQAQVDKEMQEALERTNLFWGNMTDRTADNAAKITAAIKEASKDSYAMDAQSFRDRLEANEVFGETVKAMSEEQFAAYLILLQQFHVKTIEADKKAAEERAKVVEQRMKDLGISDAYEAADKVIGIREAEHEFKSSNDAYASKKKEFETEQQLIMQRIALDEWYYELHYEMLKQAGAKENELTELQMKHMEKRNEYQAQLVNNYADRFQDMADVADTYGTMIGDGLTKLALGEEDAGKELIKNLLLETIQMGAEFAKRLVMEQAFGTAMLSIKNTQYAAQATAAYGAAMTEVGIEASKMAAIEAIAAGEITAQSLKQPDSILTFGASGLGRASLLIGLIATATAAAMAIVNSLFSGSTSKAESASSKRLATGMLTYASGRYPVEGDDGVTYDAQYEPRLQTKIYQGGKGKAHMALFSEVMPEMVISGPTTKIIQEDFPALMNAILTIDKYGTLPQPRRIRRYEAGNLDEFDVDMQQGADGTYTESPAIAELRQSNAELRDTVARLATILENGIHANINMYGKGGIKESMDKANKFYTKNRIK